MEFQSDNASGSGPFYVLTGGGTAGHVYPALAIAEAISGNDKTARFAFIGVSRGAEKEIVPKYPDLVPPERFYFVRSIGMPERKLSFRMLTFLFFLLAGTFQAFRILKKLHPKWVIGTGGYAAAPTLLAARLLSIKTMLNEQNAVPGKVNLLLGRKADVVTVSFQETVKYFPENAVLVGYPVREAIRNSASNDSTQTKAEVRKELGVKPKQKLVLITGGSSGARSINRMMAYAVKSISEDENLRNRFSIVHGVGRADTEDYRAWDDTQDRFDDLGLVPENLGDFYVRRRYLFDMERYYAAADVIVCRGGAGSISEAAAFGKPLLVIPKSGLPGNHQVQNAKALQEAGACRVILEEVDSQSGMYCIDPGLFLKELSGLVQQSDEVKKMGAQLKAIDHPGCLDKILEVVK